jgi:hypothetical protein
MLEEKVESLLRVFDEACTYKKRFSGVSSTQRLRRIAELRAQERETDRALEQARVMEISLLTNNKHLLDDEMLALVREKSNIAMREKEILSVQLDEVIAEGTRKRGRPSNDESPVPVALAVIDALVENCGLSKKKAEKVLAGIASEYGFDFTHEVFSQERRRQRALRSRK